MYKEDIQKTAQIYYKDIKKESSIKLRGKDGHAHRNTPLAFLLRGKIDIFRFL